MLASSDKSQYPRNTWKEQDAFMRDVVAPFADCNGRWWLGKMVELTDEELVVLTLQLPQGIMFVLA